MHKALKLAEKIKSKDYIYEINEQLSNCFKHKSDYKKAYEYLSRYYEIRNEIFDEQSDKMIKNLQTTYKIESLEDKIQELKNLEIKNSLSELTSALDVSEIISKTDTNGIITYVNDNFCKICGYNSNELIGKSYAILNSGYQNKEFFDKMWNTISNGKV